MTVAEALPFVRRWLADWASPKRAGRESGNTAAQTKSAGERAFRPDIEGLRGVAIFFVLLFHFRAPGFGGGFLGVDVFFVISGYLMTLIITQSLDLGRFSLVQFYLKRLTRVVPALLVLCLSLLVFGYLYLPPSDYSRLASQVAATVAFLPNVLFWLQTSYFDPASEEKWLLNAWSLGVEFQFYVLYPLLLMAARRWLPRIPVVAVIGALAAASFVVSNLLAASEPMSAFFLLPSRLWELLVGGLIVFARPPAEGFIRSVAICLGFILITASALAFDANSPWPGWRACLPVAGSAAIIWANSRSVLIDNAVLRIIGRSSYSTYLWHWPIVCFIFYREAAPETSTVLIGATCALLAGYISYTLCEKPRFAIQRAGIWGGPALIAGLGVIGVGAAFLWSTAGMPSRVSVAARVANSGFHDMSDSVERCFSYRDKLLAPCRFGNPAGDPSVILIGDSHSAAIVDALDDALKPSGGSILYEGASGCPTLVDTKASLHDSICEPFKRAYLEPIMAGAYPGVPVLIANYWYLGLDPGRTTYLTADGRLTPISLEGWRRRIVQTACAVAKTHPTYLMLPLPQYSTSVPRTLTRMIMAGDADAEVSQSLGHYLHERAELVAGMNEAARKCGVHLIDPLPAFCDRSKCLASDRQRALYYDSNHPSLFGSKRLVPIFQKAFVEDGPPTRP